MKKNLEIRKALAKNGMRQWELADALGISESTMVKRLRKELPQDEKTRILNIIDKYQAEKISE